MWPSPGTAAWLYDAANVGLIIGLILTAVATVLVVWMGNIKEEHLRREIANTQERAASAEQRAAEANQKAEEEHLARVKIEAQLAPRSLNKAQREAILDKLSAFKGSRINIFTFGETPEIIQLTSSLSTLLRAAGWNLEVWNAVGGGSVSGVLVLTRTASDKSIENAANALVSALNESGIAAGKWQSFSDPAPPATMVTGPTWDASKIAPIRMLIGNKP